LIFSKEWTLPENIWQRFTLHWDRPVKDIIPHMMLIVSDPDRPWCKENVISLKGNPQSNIVNMWVLCPYSERTQESSLRHYQQSAMDQLRACLPGLSMTCHDPIPQQNHEYFVQYKPHDNINKRFGKPFPLLHLNPESVGKVDTYSLMKGAVFFERILQECLGDKHA